MDDAEELYQRRIASRFAVLDQEGSGYISREDFTTAAGRLLAEFGVPHRSDRGQALAYGAEAFWQGLAGIADVDGDQRVTHEEFAHGAVKRLHDNPERFAEIARPFVRAVLALPDEDGGGRGGTAGVERALRCSACPGDRGAGRRVPRRTGDGRVAEEDAVAALARYFMLR